jgi:hypothetical protein
MSQPNIIINGGNVNFTNCVFNAGVVTVGEQPVVGGATSPQVLVQGPVQQSVGPSISSPLVSWTVPPTVLPQKTTRDNTAKRKKGRGAANLKSRGANRYQDAE